MGTRRRNRCATSLGVDIVSSVTTQTSPSCLQTLTPQGMSLDMPIWAQAPCFLFSSTKVFPCPTVQGQSFPQSGSYRPLSGALPIPRACPPVFPGFCPPLDYLLLRWLTSHAEVFSWGSERGPQGLTGSEDIGSEKLRETCLRRHPTGSPFLPGEPFRLLLLISPLAPEMKQK